MIVIEDEPNSPGERSPLKGAVSSPVTPSAAGPPPPPYVATPAPVQSYRAVPPNPHTPVPPPRRHSRSPFKRFIKAFGVALLVLFLWGMFLDSIDMLMGRHSRPHTPDPRPGRGHGHGHGYGLSMDWILSTWNPDSNVFLPPALPADKPCQPTVEDATAGRMLPIQYPPTLSAS